MMPNDKPVEAYTSQPTGASPVRMIRCIHMIALLFVLAGPSALAKHGPPPEIEPVVHEGVRYVVPNDDGLRGLLKPGM